MSTILNQVFYPNIDYAFKSHPDFVNLFESVIKIQQTSNLMLNTKILKSTITYGKSNNLYKGSTLFDRTTDINNRIEDPTYLLPNKSIVSKVDENIRTAYIPFVGEPLNLGENSSYVFQLDPTIVIPNVKYNVYIMYYFQGTYGYNGLIESGKYIPEKLNLLSLASSSPQDFISSIDSSKIKISRIGEPVNSNEYSIDELIKDLYIRESSTSSKLGNLKILPFTEGIEYIQIAKEVSKDDTIVLMNHNPFVPASNKNQLNFDSLFYVPVGTNLDTYLAEEKLKKELIKMKLIETITGKIN